jgi:hypothetical protein
MTETGETNLCVMVGLVPTIHVFVLLKSKAWLLGTRPSMTAVP